MRKKTTQEFINDAIKIHGNFYDYSKVVYDGAHTKVCIGCPIHGDYWQKPNGHLDGKGCCSNYTDGRTSNKKKDLSTFISEAGKAHGIGRYDYSKSIYIDRKTPLTVICHEHDEPYEFYPQPHNHIKSKNPTGCPLCSGKLKHTKESFSFAGSDKFKGKFDYNKVVYIDNKTHVCIDCPTHGEFWQRPDNHLASKHGCDKCKQELKESKAVTDITDILNINLINFNKEQRFEKCKNINCLPFDFFIEEFNLCIEYDGIQHFQPIKLWGGDEGYKKQLINDSIKDQYCFDNNVNLLRIRYDENHISVLKDYFKNNFNIDLKE